MKTTLFLIIISILGQIGINYTISFWADYSILIMFYSNCENCETGYYFFIFFYLFNCLFTFCTTYYIDKALGMQYSFLTLRTLFSSAISVAYIKIYDINYLSSASLQNSVLMIII